MEKLAEMALRYVGTRRKQKPIDYISMAKGFEWKLKQLGSIEAVAKKAHATPKQISDFLKILTLPPKVQELIKERKIGINTASRLASRRLLQKEQELLADAVIKHKLSWREVMEIVKFKAENPKFTIDECIKSILRSRPVIEKHHVIMTEIKQLRSRKFESLEKSGTSLEEALANIIKKGLHDSASFISLRIRGDLILLELREDAYLTIKEKAEKLGVDTGSLVGKLIEDGLRDL